MMSAYKGRRAFHSLLVVAFSLCLHACAKPPQPAQEEQPPEATQPAEAPETPLSEQPSEPLPAPTIAEATSALARVYEDAVGLDPSRSPSFVVGDFNGDRSQDIALVVRPNKSRLADINSEVANWIIRDALASGAPQPGMKRDPDSAPIRPQIGEKDDVLLTVIHGYGQKGWRDGQARQSYLIRNAVGRGLEVLTKKSLIANKAKKKPPLIGDVIQETMSGSTGFVYYTGSAYAWFDPRTYKGEPTSRLAH